MRKTILFIVALCLFLGAGARPKVGLVFGGGGAKGAAEVGVLKVIEQAGIPIDYVAGTSIGAVVGCLYASGYNATELDTLFSTQEWMTLLTDHDDKLTTEPYVVRDGVTYIFGFPVFQSGEPLLGVVSGNKIMQLIDSLTGKRGADSFESMEKPFCCVAADLKTITEVDISEGPLAQAVRASMAIPGVFKPVRRDNQLLIDGGMMNNLPVDVVRRMGADVVIAIDLQQSKPAPRQPADKEALGFLELLGIPMLSGLVDWVVNRPDQRKYLENVAAADLVIRPDLPDYEASNFGNRNSRRMIDIGERDAKKQWDKLQDLLNLLQD